PLLLHSFPTRRSSDLWPRLRHGPCPRRRWAKAAPRSGSASWLRYRLLLVEIGRTAHAPVTGPGEQGAGLIDDRDRVGRKLGDRGDRKSTRLNSSHVAI